MIPRLLSIACLVLCLVAKAVAEEKKAGPHWLVTAECQMLLVPQKIAVGLIDDLGDDERMYSTWERVLKLLEEEKIELLGRVVVKGNAGTKLISEAGEEIQYPTNFDSPDLPDRGAQPADVEILKAWPAVGVIPTAFTTRSVGQKLEIEARVSDDGLWITAETIAEHVRFMKWMKFDIGRLANGERITLEQPFFHTMKTTISARLQNEQRMLIGVHKTPDPAQKSFELFVLHLKATKSGVSE